MDMSTLDSKFFLMFFFFFLRNFYYVTIVSISLEIPQALPVPQPLLLFFRPVLIPL